MIVFLGPFELPEESGDGLVVLLEQDDGIHGMHSHDRLAGVVPLPLPAKGPPYTCQVSNASALARTTGDG